MEIVDGRDADRITSSSMEFFMLNVFVNYNLFIHYETIKYLYIVPIVSVIILNVVIKTNRDSNSLI